MQKTKALLIALAVTSMAFGLAFTAQAAEPTLALAEVTVTETADVTFEEEVDPVLLLTQELATLKAKFTDPTTGRIARFFLRIKINELTNQLNIQKAVQ